MPEVRLVDVSKRFGKVVAVNKVKLRVEDGEYLSIVGPSGCGKTTTLRIVAGLVRQDEGDVYIGEKLVNDIPPEDRGIGFVFQHFAVFPHMTVWGNVTYGPRIAGWDPDKIDETATEALKKNRLFGRADAYPDELSLGELQRVGLARVLATGAKLLLLDEPLGSLDMKIRQELRYELRRIVKSLGLTAIHVTHDQEEAMTISDKIVVMRAGRISQVGAPEELYDNPSNVFVANFIGKANFLEGVVTKINKEALIELRGGLTVRTRDKSFKRGRKVVVAVRPEKLRIEAGRKRGLNCLHGKVERAKFVGWLNRFEVRLDNDDLVTVEKPVFEARPFNVGVHVTVRFKPDQVSVYRYPKRGLQRALALE